MHPAYSVIYFTCATGAGYGLLIWLAVFAMMGALPLTPAFGLAGLGVSMALVATGLLSSTSHLGRPERAWRAFSQWRSSWLSREGVFAIATFVPIAVLALGWIVEGRSDGVYAVAAAAAAVLALVTVYCTGMIYQSLPTIRAWHLPMVTPIYLALGLATGAVLMVALMAGFGALAQAHLMLTLAVLGGAWLMKFAYWSTIDGAPRDWKIGAATGLGRFGEVRPLDPPHSKPNFVMREMGYQVARKHALKLRRMAIALGLAVPAGLLITVLLGGLQAAAFPLAVLAAMSALAGVLVERWLFFAEAEHVAMLYYGKQEA